MKTAVFWVVAPQNLVQIARRVRGNYCLHHQGDETVDMAGRRIFAAISCESV
jgi:hypothetical protein